MATGSEVFLNIPTTIPSCTLWLDAADRTSLTFSGSSISQWSDKSGNANHCTQADINRYPIYLSTNGINSVPALYFTGPASCNAQSQFLQNSAISVNGAAYSMFVVGHQDTVAPSRYSYNYMIKGSLTSDYTLIYGSGPSGFFVTGVGNGTSAWNDLTENSPNYSVKNPFVSGMIMNGATMSPFFNGSNQTTKSGAAASWTGLSIGEPQPNGFSGQTWNGKIGEVLLYTKVLTATERQLVEGYLAWKWGVQASLPTSHPYKSYRPLAGAPFPTVAPPGRLTNPILYSPLQASNLNLWLDSYDGTRNTLAADKTTINSVTDKSANAYSLTVATSNPTVNRDNKGAYNFQGSYQYLQYPVAAINNTNNYNLFMVATFQSQSQILMSKQADYVNTMNTLGLGWFPGGQLAGQTGQLIWWPYNNNGFSNPTMLSTNTMYLIQIGYDATNLFFRINGQQTSTITTANGNIINEGAGNPAIGNMWSGYWQTNKFGSTPAVQNWNLHEMLFYNTYKNTATQQAIEGYLAWKWGMQSSLIASHPYYTNPPYINTGIFPSNTGTVFAPTSLSNCILWLDAADSSAFGLTGSNVNTWRDKSASAAHATGGGTLPYYNSNERYVYFGGAGYLSNLALSFGLATRSVFIVARQNALASSTAFEGVMVFGAPNVIDYASANAIVYCGRGSNVNANVSFNVFYNSGNLNLKYGSCNVPMPLGLYDEVYPITTNTSALFVDGNSNTSGTTTTTGTSTGYYVGCRNDLGNGTARSFLNGAIYEVIAYNRVVTAAERQRIEGYLAWKWNLQPNLSTIHPYKASQNYVVPNFPPRLSRQNFTWVPTRITGCVCWCDASDLTTITFSSGSNVTQISDKSPNSNNHYVCSGTLVSGNLATNMTSLQTPIGTTSKNHGISGNSPMTYVFVSGYASGGSTYIRGDLTEAGGNAYTGSFSMTPAYYTNGQAVGVNQVGGLINVAGRAIFTKLQVATWTGSVATLHECGQLMATSGTTTLNQVSGKTNITRNTNDAQFGEFMIFNKAFTELERQQIEGYLAWKWGLQANLPATHAYTKFPPL